MNTATVPSHSKFRRYYFFKAGSIQHAAAFIDALGIKKLDALGFSMGGLIAQQLTMDRPDLVRKLILVGTGPRSGEGMASLTPEAQEIFGAKYDPADEVWL